MIFRLRSPKIVRELRRDTAKRERAKAVPAAGVASGARVKKKIFHFQFDNARGAS
jgi:hypothetical protein